LSLVIVELCCSGDLLCPLCFHKNRNCHLSFLNCIVQPSSFVYCGSIEKKLSLVFFELCRSGDLYYKSGVIISLLSFDSKKLYLVLVELFRSGHLIDFFTLCFLAENQFSPIDLLYCVDYFLYSLLVGATSKLIKFQILGAV